LNIVPLEVLSFVKNFKQMPLLEHDGKLYKPKIQLEEDKSMIDLFLEPEA